MRLFKILDDELLCSLTNDLKKKNPMKASFNLTSLMTFIKDLKSQVHVVFHLLIHYGFNYIK